MDKRSKEMWVGFISQEEKKKEDMREEENKNIH